MHYDAAAEATFEGTVTSVDEVARGPMGPGIHIQLETSDGPLETRLGPSRFLEEIGLQLHEGDTITVEGALTDGAVTARIVRRGDEIWTLRDPEGVPLWRGRGRRRSRVP